jgi:uncharacterized protein (TIGR03435 family)
MAQTSPKVEFEVVSVKPSPIPEPGKGYVVGCSGGPDSKDRGMFRCSNMNLPNLITRAYDIMNYQLSGPAAMRDYRFDIEARIPDGTTKDQFRLMIQNMLIDRLKLVIHHETRELPKYYLTVTKGGPKLKVSVDAPPKNADSPQPPSGSGQPVLDKDGYPVLLPGRSGLMMDKNRARLFLPQSTMEQFAKQLASQLRRPVTDATGLTGKYEISLFWIDDVMEGATASSPAADTVPLPPAPDSETGPSLEKAVQDQLGLRLELKKGPADVLVVDHFEKSPTSN